MLAPLSACQGKLVDESTKDIFQDLQFSISDKNVKDI